MEELANKSDTSFELPEGHPQTKQVVAEQVAVIKDVKGIRKRKAEANVIEKTASEANQKVFSQASAQISKTEASGSNVRLSSKGKPTNFSTNRTSQSSSSTRKTMAEKMKENAPYNLFFTEINDSPNTLKQKNSVTFSGAVPAQMFVFCVNGSLVLRFGVSVFGRSEVLATAKLHDRHHVADGAVCKTHPRVISSYSFNNYIKLRPNFAVKSQ